MDASETRAALTHLYDALARRDGAAMAALYADDAVFEDPVFRLRGADIGKMWIGLTARAKNFAISYSVVEAGTDSGSVELTARYLFAGRRPVVNAIRSDLAFARRSHRPADRPVRFPALGGPGARPGRPPLRTLRLVPQEACPGARGGGSVCRPSPYNPRARKPPIEGETMKRFFLLAAALLAAGTFAFAQDARTPTPAAPDKSKDKERREASPRKKSRSSRTTRSTIGGKPFAYTATAGYMPMKDENGKLKANIFFVAYTKDGGAGASARSPSRSTAGPGSSSVWLHLGALGPKRVVHDRRGLGRCLPRTASWTTSSPGSPSPTSSSSIP